MTSGAARVAIVTGGSRGVGRAVCLALARQGHDVAVNFRRDRGAADEVAAQIEAMGRRAIVVEGSVATPEVVEDLVATTVSRLGAPSILVHNAGIASSGRTVVDTDPAELSRVMSVHAFGAFYLAKYALPYMIEARTGDVIFISSGASEVRAPNAAPYCMGKVALDCLATVLSKEVQRYNIRVNVVAPGLVASDMGDKLVQAWSGGEATTAYDWDSRSPFGRVCRPEDVANVVAMLLAVPDSYISGAWIRVDGGGRTA